VIGRPPITRRSPCWRAQQVPTGRHPHRGELPRTVAEHADA
jgi:hypothetical protein